MRKGLGTSLEGSLYRLQAVGINHVVSPDYAYVGNLVVYGFYTFKNDSPHPELRLGIGNTRIETGNPQVGYDGVSYLAALVVGEDFKKGPGFVQGKLSYIWGDRNTAPIPSPGTTRPASRY